MRWTEAGIGTWACAFSYGAQVTDLGAVIPHGLLNIVEPSGWSGHLYDEPYSTKWTNVTPTLNIVSYCIPCGHIYSGVSEMILIAFNMNLEVMWMYSVPRCTTIVCTVAVSCADMCGVNRSVSSHPLSPVWPVMTSWSTSLWACVNQSRRENIIRRHFDPYDFPNMSSLFWSLVGTMWRWPQRLTSWSWRGHASSGCVVLQSHCRVLMTLLPFVEQW
jgi:hypothetical protein